MFDVLIVGAGKFGSDIPLPARLTLSRAFRLVRCEDIAGV